MLQQSPLHAQTSSMLQKDVIVRNELQVPQKMENTGKFLVVSNTTIPTNNARPLISVKRPLSLSINASLHNDNDEIQAGCTRQLQRPNNISLTTEESELRERALKRRNDSAAALGNLRRFQCGKLKLYFGPKFYIYFIVSAITLAIIVANMAMVWTEVGSWEFAVTIVVLCITFASSWLVMSTDPGIYPRLRVNEVDCLGTNEGLRYCRVCKLNRPPRTSHCYQCDVCIFDHDHHCDILGACVGARNLRWFTLYLLSCSTSTFIGVWWLSRSFVRNVFNAPNVITHEINEHGAKQQHNNNTTINNKRFNERGMEGSCASGDCDEGARHVFIFLLIIVDALVGFLVGGLGVLYLYLTANSMTRRMWNDEQVRHDTLEYLRVVNHNPNSNNRHINHNNRWIENDELLSEQLEHEEQEKQLCRRDKHKTWWQGCTGKCGCIVNNLWAVAFPPASMLSSPSITAFCGTPMSNRVYFQDTCNCIRSEETYNEFNSNSNDCYCQNSNVPSILERQV